MFAVILITFLLAALWLPSAVVLVFVGRVSLAGMLRKAWRVWAGQVALAATLIYLADTLSLANPAGYTAAICFGLGGGAAGYFWLAVRHQRAGVN